MNIRKNLQEVREEISRLSGDAILIPMKCSFDNLDNEYSDLYLVSGFTGSNGRAVVSSKKAILSVDGRYSKQAKEQTEDFGWNVENYPLCDTKCLIEKALKKGETLVVSSLAHSYKTYVEINHVCVDLGINLKTVKEHPVSEIGNVNKNYTKLFIKNSEKIKNRLERIQNDLKEGEVFLFADKGTIAWILGIKKTKLPPDKNPTAEALLCIPKFGRPFLFCDLEAVENDFFHSFSFSEFENVMSGLQKNIVKVCFPSVPAYFVLSLLDMGFDIECVTKNYSSYETIKDEDEINSQRKGALNTSVVFAKTLAFVEHSLKNGAQLRESDVVEYFENAAKKFFGDNFIGFAFNPISSYGKSTSIVHYNHNAGDNNILENNGLFLMDSGLHFKDSTTDMTRTIYLGDNIPKTLTCYYTIVLKAVIALSSAVFVRNIKACQLDTLCRHKMWKYGMDFDFGTGHGVGCYGNVHEHPRISKNSLESINSGMVITVEPGYYTSDFGVRIENMILTTENDFGMLNFETLTYIPLCLKLIDKSLLNSEEISWINDYSRLTEKKLAKYFADDDITRNWILENTKNL